MTDHDAHHIRYASVLDGIDHTMLEGFFVGWPNPPSAETLHRILAQSWAIELAIDESTGRVVGFINAISDGVLSVYIPLLEVVPEHHGRGIGSTLVERLRSRCADLYMVDVVCDENVVPFYERFGFIAGRSMMLRNWDHQSGRHA